MLIQNVSHRTFIETVLPWPLAARMIICFVWQRPLLLPIVIFGIITSSGVSVPRPIKWPWLPVNSSNPICRVAGSMNFSWLNSGTSALPITGIYVLFIKDGFTIPVLPNRCNRVWVFPVAGRSSRVTVLPAGSCSSISAFLLTDVLSIAPPTESFDALSALLR